MRPPLLRSAVWMLAKSRGGPWVCHRRRAARREAKRWVCHQCDSERASQPSYALGRSHGFDELRLYYLAQNNSFSVFSAVAETVPTPIVPTETLAKGIPLAPHRGRRLMALLQIHSLVIWGEPSDINTRRERTRGPAWRPFVLVTYRLQISRTWTVRNGEFPCC
jgi:hypothetical protein